MFSYSLWLVITGENRTVIFTTLHKKNDKLWFQLLITNKVSFDNFHIHEMVVSSERYYLTTLSIFFLERDLGRKEIVRKGFPEEEEEDLPYTTVSRTFFFSQTCPRKLSLHFHLNLCSLFYDDW